MKCPKSLKFSPIAWAKIKWMVARGDKLEISGFGVSKEDDPFSIVDFHTLKQECTGVETSMDDKACNQYMERMAKKGIAPNRCMRVWIHSHPFSTGTPSPSGTDNTTLEEKTGADSHWSIMVIMGQGTPFARLQIREELLDNEPIEMEMDCEVDWTLLATPKILDEWKKEFTANVHEAKPVIVENTRKSFWTPGSSNPQYKGNGKKGKKGKTGKPKTLDQRQWKRTFTDYKKEWNSFGCHGGPEWLVETTKMTIWTYITAREEGYTPDEIGYWGDLVIVCEKETLIGGQAKLEKEAAIELAEIRSRGICAAADYAGFDYDDEENEVILP